MISVFMSHNLHIHVNITLYTHTYTQIHTHALINTQTVRMCVIDIFHLQRMELAKNSML